MAVPLSGKWKSEESLAHSRDHQEHGGLVSELEGHGCIIAAARGVACTAGVASKDVRGSCLLYHQCLQSCTSVSGELLTELHHVTRSRHPFNEKWFDFVFALCHVLCEKLYICSFSLLCNPYFNTTE